MRFFVSLTLLFCLSLPGCGGGSAEPIEESADSAVEMTDEEVAAEEALESGEEDASAEAGDDTDV